MAFEFGAAAANTSSRRILKSARYPPPTPGTEAHGWRCNESIAPPSPPEQGFCEPLQSPGALADGVEGVVCFKSREGSTYRYRITAKNAKLWIWLEDLKSKRQWQTDELAQESFLNDDLVIPHASFEDYAMCFANCLRSATSEDLSSDLVAADVADVWELRLTLNVGVFLKVWSLTYRFQLKPIALETVDLLAAKIRDQEDQIRSLQARVSGLLAKPEKPKIISPVYMTAKLAKKFTAGQTLVWRQEGILFGTGGEIILESSGTIRFTVAAAFVVNVVIQHNNSNNSTAYELQLNGKTLVSCVDSNGQGHNTTAPLCHVLTTAPDDKLTVVYRGGNSCHEAGSYIVIHQLR